MKERDDKKAAKHKKAGEDRNSPQRRGSAFNEKPGGQPAHSKAGTAQGNLPVNDDNEPPGLPGRDNKKGDGSDL